MLERIKQRVVALALSALTVCGAVQAYALTSATATATSAGRPVESVLPNGLKVILFEDHSFPVVSCFIWYRVGARNEPSGLTGISHVLEHMLFQNVGPFQHGALSAMLARNGAQFNGYTSDDFTTFYELINPSKLELAIKAEAIRMRGGTFSPSDLKEEISRVEQELIDEAQDPAAALSKEVRATAFHQHPYGNPVTGWRCDLESLTTADLKAFYDRFYYPNNATLVLVGDFQRQNASQLINKYFGPIKSSAAAMPAMRAVEALQTAERRVYMKYAGKKEFAYLAYHAPKYGDPDAPPMVVLEKLLNAQLSGRLKSKFLEAKICSSAHSAFELKKDPGLFVVSLGAATGVPLSKVVDTWDTTIGQLRSQPISDADLRRAKNQAEYALLNDRDGPYKMGFHLGFCDSVQSWQSAYEWLERLRAVNAGDVERVAKRYFNTENRVVGLLGTNSPPPAKPAPQPSPGGKGPVAIDLPAAPDRIAARERTVRSNSFGHPPTWCYKSAPDKSGARKLPYLLAQLDMDDVSQSALDTPVSAKTDADKAAEQGKVQPAAEPGSASDPAAAETTAPASDSTQSADKKAAPGDDGHAGQADAKQPPTVQYSDVSIHLPPGADADATAAPPSGTAANTQTQSGSSTPADVTAAATGTARASLLPVRERKLRNGVTLLVYETHLSPVVQIMGSIKAGEVYEPAAKRGVAELLTACFNSGSTKFPKAQLQAQQEDIGLPTDAMLRFKCGAQNITFQTRCLSRDLQKQLGTLSTILRDPTLSDADVDHARGDACWLLKHADESLDSKVERAFYRSVLAPSSGFYPSDPSALIKSIGQLKPADVKEFLMESVAPECTTLVVTGDIDPDVAARLAEQAFDGWTHSASFKGKNAPEAQPNPKHILKSSIPVHDKGKNLLCLGKLVPINMTDQRYSYLLISDCALMNHPLIGRLAQRFTQEPTLARALSNDEIETRLTPLGTSTAWSISLPVESAEVQRAAILVQNELKQFGRSGISATELTEAKRYLINALPVKQASNTQQAAFTCLNANVAGAKANYLEVVTDDIQNASIDAVNRFLHTEFKPEQSTLVIAGSRESIRDVHGISNSDNNNNSHVSSMTSIR